MTKHEQLDLGEQLHQRANVLAGDHFMSTVTTPTYALLRLAAAEIERLTANQESTRRGAEAIIADLQARLASVEAERDEEPRRSLLRRVVDELAKSDPAGGPTLPVDVYASERVPGEPSERVAPDGARVIELEPRTEGVECGMCERVWPDDSEQAESIRSNGHCIVCAIWLERMEAEGEAQTVNELAGLMSEPGELEARQGRRVHALESDARLRRVSEPEAELARLRALVEEAVDEIDYWHRSFHANLDHKRANLLKRLRRASGGTT